MIGLKVQVTAGGLIAFGKKRLRATIRQAAAEVAKDARALIRAKLGGGRTYYGSGGVRGEKGTYKRGKHQASAPGDAPNSVTGTLARSLKVSLFKSGEGAAIRDRAFYAVFLEAGARGGAPSGRKGQRGRSNKRGAVASGRVLAPRPFLTVALERKQGSIEQRLKDAVERDIAWQKSP